MLFTLEPLQAAEGDCLLLHWGTLADPKLAVIDGGPGRVYENALKPRLKQIATARAKRPLPIDLVMVSHMDSDHIVGVKKLFREMVRAIESNTPPNQRAYKVARLWHNVFNDILDDSTDAYYRTLTATLQASVADSPNPEVARRIAKAFETRHQVSPERAAFEADAISHLLAGHADGRVLRDDHAFLRDKNAIASLNAPFQRNGKPTLISSDGAVPVVMAGGLTVNVFGPRRTELEALQKEFDKFIKAEGLTVESVLAAYADKSAKNLSSIVCLLSVGEGDAMRDILFTGDARGDHILSVLEAAGELDDQEFWVDVLKVPHHGSSNNVEQDFFERILADHYVFSGDGKHSNPDRDTLQWLIDARGEDGDYHMHFTYPIVDIDKVRKTVYAKEGWAWTHQADSLQALLDDHLTRGYAFTVHEGPGLRIELGDETLDA